MIDANAMTVRKKNVNEKRRTFWDLIQQQLTTLGKIIVTETKNKKN